MSLAVGFASALREAGLTVATGSVLTFARALDAVGLETRDGPYWAGRATLVHRPEDIGLYDSTFDRWWLGARASAAEEEEVVEVVPIAMDSEDAADAPDAEPGSDRTMVVRASPVEVLRVKDFAVCTTDELAEAHALMADIRLAGALRRTRRLRPSRRRGQLDLRRTVRSSLRTGGEVLDRAWLAPSRRPRRVILLVDVSGSMELYARALLRFAHVAVAAGHKVEAFALGTRLTRLTRELSSRDPDAALAASARATPDMAGGTRLGEGLRVFNDRWGVRGMARGAVVVLLSDGWDRGDPAVLAEQMARLHRVAHRIVWANPLRASPGYEPLARGMASALPYVDEFVDGHSLQSLEDLVKVVARA